MTDKLATTTPSFLLPDLIEIQRASFRWFLEEGLIEANAVVFDEIFSEIFMIARVHANLRG